MRTSVVNLMCLVAAVAGGQALAKLPPLTPDELARAAMAAEQSKMQAAAEQAALTRVQDRVAEQYRRDLTARGLTPPAPTPVGPTPQANLPKTVVEPPRSAGPHGGNTPSAEAHSGNAR